MGWKESLLKTGSKLKGAGGWLKEKAPAAGSAAKGASLKGFAAGGAAVGAGLAAGSAATRGIAGAGRRGWQISKQLFSAINILLIASVLLHFFDIATDFGNHRMRGMFLIFFAVYAWLFIFSTQAGGMGDIKALKFPLMISFIAIILPILFLNQTVINFTGMKELFTNLLVFIPVWPIVIMLGMPTTRLVKAAKVIYILFIVVMIVPSAWYAISTDYNIETARVGALKVLYDGWDNFEKGIKYSYETIVSAPGKIRGAAQQQIQYAVGDYYTGQVEQGKNQPIGVFIENVEPAATEFYADDIVVVWATLLARTLDPDKEIKVTASCFGEKKVGEGAAMKLKKVKGDADPLSDKDTFTMKTVAEDEKFITCEFPPLFFEEGLKNIFVNANFNFRTLSYINSYFMNLETLRTMRREGIDPLVQYEVPDRSPASISTSGPISLNIGTSSVPVGVSTTEPVDIRLGITMENVWEGMIKEVKDITIKIPESMEITFCDHAFEKVACTGDECEDGKYTVVYKIKKSRTAGRMGLDSIKNVAGYHSISCRVKVNDVNRLMGNYPLVSRYFKVSADYTYSLEKSTAVNIKKALGDGTGISTTTPVTQIRPPSFSYSPTSSSITLNTGQQKAFTVAIRNPGDIAYAWKSEGIVEDSIPDVTSYIFSSDQPGEAVITFVAVEKDGTPVEERIWNINVVE